MEATAGAKLADTIEQLIIAFRASDMSTLTFCTRLLALITPYLGLLANQRYGE